MINVLCLYLVNICLIFFIFYMSYKLVKVGRTLSSGWGRDRPRKHGLPLTPIPYPPLPLCLRPPFPWVAPPSLLVHILKSLLWYPTLDMITWSLCRHSCSRLLHLHPHLHEVRPAISLLLCLPLVSLVCRMPRPPHPLTRLHELASGA